MNFVFFIHSLASDWNHGNAHFVRGVLSDLLQRGHDVTVFEQQDNWSRWYLEQDHGKGASSAYLDAYPQLAGVAHDYTLPPETNERFPTAAHVDEVAAALDLDVMLGEADVVIVHEWTPPALVAAIGRHHKTHDHYRLLFHDTHHRVVSEPRAMAAFDLSGYDGVLAFGDVLREAYRRRKTVPHAWTWHEAADTNLFKPRHSEKSRDLVWIGNWGDGERTAQLHEFLLGPVKALGLSARVHGVRYPDDAKNALADTGMEFAGYLPNHRAPQAFAEARVTVHVPRQFYVTHLPGIPTIRPFEALACGIPLVCSPWYDSEGLFTAGRDYLMAADGAEMRVQLKRVLEEPGLREDLIGHGLETIRTRHTCRHRVDELLTYLDQLPG